MREWKVKMGHAARKEWVEQEVAIPAGEDVLKGNLTVPPGARGMVVFAHGSASSRLSPRNRYVASVLHEAKMGTLLFDLLTHEEGKGGGRSNGVHANIPFLSERLIAAIEQVKRRTLFASQLPLGCFGSSTGAAACLAAAACFSDTVRAIVSRGGRTGLAKEWLAAVRAPTLLIVGGNDAGVLAENEESLKGLAAEDKQIFVVPDAGHLFEEVGSLEKAAEAAARWFQGHL